MQRSRPSLGIVAALALAAAVATPAAAQPLARRAPPAPLPHRSALDVPAGTYAAVLVERAQEPDRTIHPGVAFLASAVVPGAGQYLQGADRWFPYLIVEAWAILTVLDQRADARDFERRYRDLAWFVARRTSTPPRRDSVFEYYEDMARFGASGAFDANAALPGVQPERDPETFNGQLWLLAQALFVDGGEALRYYESRAIATSFTWAWGDSNLERQVFAELIRESDEAFRNATTALGVLLANHMVSAVDALVLSRLRTAGAGERRLRLRSGLESGPTGVRWSSSLSFHF